MFRALWIKHWAQLRTLRWVGFGLGVVLPFFLWAGAAASRRGWFGISLGSYDLATLFGEALPGLSAALWGLLAVMFAAQTFAGDRADGTDRFMLDRPVPRRRVWFTRVLVSLASSLVVLVANTLYITALVALVHDGSDTLLYSGILTAAWVGVGLAILGTMGGMAAGDMAGTPMQAVLVGGVLAALPIGVATFLASVFELAQVGDVHLAVVVTPILPLALILVSYRASCLGEPAGRGRIKRGLTVLAIALLATPLLFAAVAPFAVRAGVSVGWLDGTAIHADRTVAMGGNHRSQGGWMINTATGEKIRFLPPPVRSAAWNADGSKLAVIHQWGPLGSIGSVRLELIDGNGSTEQSFPLEDNDSFAQDVYWAGNLVLVRESLSYPRTAIRVIDPAQGVLGSVGIESDMSRSWTILGPTEDGSVYIHRLVDQQPRVYELNRLNLESFRLGPPLLTEADDLPTYTAKLLSPSGRYLARVIKEDQAYVSRVFDLKTGKRIDYVDSMISGWLTGDRVVRLEKDEEQVRVIVHEIDGVETQSRRFARRVSAKVSPDGKMFLVTQTAMDDPGFGYSFFRSMAVAGIDQFFVTDGNEWTDLQSLIPGLSGEHVWVAWGGPSTLIATRNGSNAVADVRSGADWTAVVGRWP
jgi:hypothetical protein